MFPTALLTLACASLAAAQGTFLDTLNYKFTLAAVYTGQGVKNANETGVPLVLGQDGTTRGIVFHVSSVRLPPLPSKR